MLAVYIYLALAAVCFTFCAIFFRATLRPMAWWITPLVMGYVFVVAALINLLLETV